MFAYLNYLNFLFPSKIPPELIRPIAALLQFVHAGLIFPAALHGTRKEKKRMSKKVGGEVPAGEVVGEEMSAMLWREVMLGQ